MEEELKQRQSDCIKVVLYGPESTGKTTLAKQLAAHFKTTYAPEFMREYLQEKWDLESKTCTLSDLMPIARGQINNENEATLHSNKILFCDTNLRELKVYSEYYYDGVCPKPIREAVKIHSYDHYFLTDIDVPWEKDDLRDRPEDRSTLFSIFETELKRNKIPYQLLSGTKLQRLETAINYINKLLD